MGPTKPLSPEQAQARKQRQVLEKDATELALENALFGNQTAFLDSLTHTNEKYQELELYRGADSDQEDVDSDNEAGMQDVADEDLFFLDAGDSNLPDDVMEDLRQETETIKPERSVRQVLWHDSDDDRLVVSLASNTRLRKLRDTEEDDIVTGSEYIRRLRRQYERLHPTPDWVKYARKKRKTTSERDESDSDSDVSIDSPSVKPLAELLRSTALLTRQTPLAGDRSSTLNLRPESIDIQRLKDIASSGPSSIDTLAFHPRLPLVMTAGPSSTITLYHLSPASQNPNPILTSLHVKGTPITSALFAQQTGVPDSDTRVYLSARRRYFHSWSLASGTMQKISRPLYQSDSLAGRSDAALLKSSKKNHEIPTCERIKISPDSAYLAIISNTGSNGGVVHILNATTHQPIAQVRVDSLNGIADLAFYRDSSGLSVVGKNGEVSEYNITERRVTARWTDQGAVGTTTLALGGEIRNTASTTGTDLMGDDRYVAIGSISGIVAIYDRIQILQKCAKSQTARSGTTAALDTTTFRPIPLRSLENLTTPISHLCFSADTNGQILVMASRWKKDALRLVHLPTCTVYKNWPTDKTPLGRISSVALGHDGGFLAVGNEAGKVRLWQIRD